MTALLTMVPDQAVATTEQVGKAEQHPSLEFVLGSGLSGWGGLRAYKLWRLEVGRMQIWTISGVGFRDYLRALFI